jgi:hypothetical protein
VVLFGARAVGLGRPSRRTALGAEGIWWNAAALARVKSKESRSIIRRPFWRIARCRLVFPSRVIGTVAIAGYFVDYGDVQATDEQQSDGVVSNARTCCPRRMHHWSRAARAHVQVLHAAIQYCSGLQWTGGRRGSSSALGRLVRAANRLSRQSWDVGSQRGPKLQVKDQPQADPAAHPSGCRVVAIAHSPQRVHAGMGSDMMSAPPSTSAGVGAPRHARSIFAGG